MLKAKCLICNKEFTYQPCKSKGKYCSYKCFYKSRIGMKFSEERNRKISIVRKGMKFSLTHRQNLKKALTGRKHSEETKRKMSKSRMGRISWHKGKKFPQITGNKHPNWKGGKINRQDGYVFIYIPNHPFCDCRGYVQEHRLVMEKMIGRYLLPKEVVHHKGIHFPLGSIENKQDNSPENLQLFKNVGEHNSFHKYLRWLILN